MKLKFILLTCIGFLFFFASCIKEEGHDREADITAISIKDKGFLTAIINDYTREISLIMAGDISKYENGTITPEISISDNSKILPESNETVTLNNFQYLYTVTAESGEKKTYSVSIKPYEPLIQNFERWNTQGKNPNRYYDMPVDPMWTDANPGVELLYRDNEPFPTRKSTEVRPGSQGQYSVLLETRMGNRVDGADIMNIPIYAGNMFRGEFNVAVALIDPLTTTLFGQPHPDYLGKAIRLEAYYKYKSGAKYTTWEYVNGKKDIKDVDGITDKPDVYAILYKVPKPKGENEKKVFLTARNIKTSEDIVATAFMEDTGEKENWTFLQTEFTYKEELDHEKYDYKLAIILASSVEGHNYKGSIGSQLYVDDLRVICESDLLEDNIKKGLAE